MSQHERNGVRCRLSNQQTTLGDTRALELYPRGAHETGHRTWVPQEWQRGETGGDTARNAQGHRRLTIPLKRRTATAA